MNYGDLKAQIADWLNRGDLATQIPAFVALAEAQFDNDPRGRVRDAVMQSTTVLTAGQTQVAVPFRYQRMEQLRVEEDGAPDLEFNTQFQLSSFEQSMPHPGRPSRYAVIGNQIQVSPEPDKSYTLRMTYFTRLTPLVADGDTNWLLALDPGIYLYGALMQAEPFLKNDERLPVWAGIYNTRMEALHTTDQWARYSGAPLTMKTRSL